MITLLLEALEVAEERLEISNCEGEEKEALATIRKAIRAAKRAELSDDEMTLMRRVLADGVRHAEDRAGMIVKDGGAAKRHARAAAKLAGKIERTW